MYTYYMNYKIQDILCGKTDENAEKIKICCGK